MKINRNTIDEINYFHSEIGNWKVNLNRSIPDLSLDLILSYFKIFKDEFPWLIVESIKPSIPDQSGQPIDGWTVNSGDMVDWFANLEINNNDLVDTIFDISLGIKIFDQNDNFLVVKTDTANLLIDYVEQNDNLAFIFSLSLNIFSPIVWSWYGDINQKIDVDIGNDLSEQNRNELKKSLKSFKEKVDATITSITSDNMNGIYEYGFEDDTSQFSF